MSGLHQTDKCATCGEPLHDGMCQVEHTHFEIGAEQMRICGYGDAAKVVKVVRFEQRAGRRIVITEHPAGGVLQLTLPVSLALEWGRFVDESGQFDAPAAPQAAAVTQFEVGKTYYTSSIGDHNCIYTVKVLGRTAKTVKALVDGRNIKTLRPSVYRDAEYVKPHGTHSMCAIVRATDTKELKPDWVK